MDGKWIMRSSIPVLLLKTSENMFAVKAANQAFMELVERDMQEFVGRDITELITASDLIWLRRYQNTNLALIEIRGRWFEIETIRDEETIAYIHKNLTEQVEMDNGYKRLQTRMKQIQIIAKIGDWEDNFVTREAFWSDEIFRMLGFKDRAIKPNVETFMRFVHPDDVKRLDGFHEAAMEGHDYQVEYRIITIDGKVRWILTRAKVDINDQGEVVRLYGTMQDVTERKRLEQKIEQAFTVVEDVYQSKTQFLAMISHEIRAPLNSILGMAQLLKNHNLDEDQSEYVEDILFSADNLLNIVEDILEMSKMEANMLEADNDEFDMHILIRNIVHMHQVKTYDSNIRFNYRIDPRVPQFVIGDGTKIQQILTNLLGNAFKFTKAGWVSLNIKVLEDSIDKSKIAFEVEDTGVGIPAEKQNQIFEFSTQNNFTLSQSGSGIGLGLAISRNYAELMNGYLFLESEVDKGSKFTFAITLNKARIVEEKQAMPLMNGHMKSMRVRVLVVEDEDMDKRYLSRMLESVCGFKVDYVEDLIGTVNALEEMTYQFVLLDTQLKKDSGIDITRVIRHQLGRSAESLPIVALTSEVSEEIKGAFFSVGGNFFIEKPVNETEFIEMIHEVLDMRSIRRKTTPSAGYRYIHVENLRQKSLSLGAVEFEEEILRNVYAHRNRIPRVLEAVSPINRLALNMEIEAIDQDLSEYGADDICESVELIKSALALEDTGGLDVIVEDFMEEFESFVNELQDYVLGMPVSKE